MGNGNKTFYKITNKDIYDSVQDLHKKMEAFEQCQTKNEARFKAHESRLDVLKVFIYAAYSVLALLVSLLAAHIMGVGS